MFLFRTIALFLVVLGSTTHAFQLHTNIKRSSLFSMNNNNNNNNNDQKKWVPKAFLPAVLGAFYAFSSPDPSHALQSGGRSGGSSFRSSGGSRSYSAPPSRSYSSGSSRTYTPRPIINIMPSYSPFGYSPFGFSPFGGFMPINLNVIILAGLAYAAYTILSNRIGGSDFSDDYGNGVVRGASVMKLTVSLDADWNQNRNIMSQLSNLASKYSAMTDKSDLAKLLSETSLALLRTRSDWTAASFSGENYRESNFQKAESSFQQLAIKERSKFEEETSGDSGNMLFRPTSVASGPKPTQAVVSIVVALRGKSEIADLKLRGISDVSRCLEQLAADALTDDGENVMALEVLWSPSSPELTLSERDLILDYPELMRL